MERAWRARDAGYDGLFFFGVKTTGIFCRPSCPSRPQRRHLEFFRNLRDAVGAGYRPCKRCHPELANGAPPEWAAKLMDRAAAMPDAPVRAGALRELGVSPERARRWFQRHYGMTFTAWCRGLRLSHAFTQLRNGRPLDDVILGHGYESHSGFRDAFARTFGQPPGHARNGDCLHAALIETPLGPMLAAASGTALCQLEFADRRGLERSYAEMRRRFTMPVVPGENQILKNCARIQARGSRANSASFPCPFPFAAHRFRSASGANCKKFPSARPPATKKSRSAWASPPPSAPSPRPTARTGCISSFPAIGSLARTANSPVTAAASGANAPSSNSNAPANCLAEPHQLGKRRFRAVAGVFPQQGHVVRVMHPSIIPRRLKIGHNKTDFPRGQMAMCLGLTKRAKQPILGLSFWGRTGFDQVNTPEAACRGWFVGLVKNRTKK